ncbi:hypothetical protein [Paraburkholderia hospita]|uniref:hypothetical protein n=1 Tax=Paraburkholderia hospita TaxID=169430 RepID=UPI0009A770A6|nr:hypothetical protein [Paraburkholderia hospita]SKC69599.1 hypothetical protein SAMN05446934_1967 [Paraburkholderia hospita]
MLTLEDDRLVFSFPEVHPDATCEIAFRRTLRIPDDNRLYPLPPGLGDFPLAHVDDYAERIPAQWLEHGGILFPMVQAEAMWIRFSSDYPFAIKVAAGKINAVSGEPWSPQLQPRRVGLNGSTEQDYVTVPQQDWLDGFNVGQGLVRQFVAMPLGAGYTVEGQLTGVEEHGGLQIIAVPLKAEHYQPPERPDVLFSPQRSMNFQASCEMGLAAGGLLKQKIYEDPFGLDKWDQTHSSRCFVHLLNSAQYQAVTGKRPPGNVPTAAEYAAAGLPWFELYDEGIPGVIPSSKLRELDSVAALGVKKGETPLPDNTPITEPLAIAGIKKIREGNL